MAILDDIKETLTKTTKSAVDKGKKLTDVTKLKSQKSSAKKELTQIYVELGKAYYEKYKDAPAEEDAENFEKISAAEEKIADIEAQIRAIKGITICPACGEENAVGKKFCGGCGAPLE